MTVMVMIIELSPNLYQYQTLHELNPITDSSSASLRLSTHCLTFLSTSLLLLQQSQTSTYLYTLSEYTLFLSLPITMLNSHHLTSTYLYTGSDGHGHESVGPLEREFVDAPVQFLHGDRLGVEDVGVTRLVERVLYPRRVEIGQRVL